MNLRGKKVVLHDMCLRDGMHAKQHQIRLEEMRSVAIALRFLVLATVLRSLVRSAQCACVCGRCLKLATTARSTRSVREHRALR